MISVENVMLPNKPLSNFGLKDAARRLKIPHWVAWNKNSKTKIYFNSYGLQPPMEVVEYLGSPIRYNTDQLQPAGQVFCGHLCLYVLKELGTGHDFQSLLNKLF